MKISRCDRGFLRQVHDEKEQATEALKKEKKEALEKSWVVKQEKDDL
jgi:hypothetical protein